MKVQITASDLLQMEQRKRAHLINSVGGFKNVCLIGTVDKIGQTNLAIFSSIVHIGANPPLISFIMRKDSV
jgi:flavin reductase (DIM6/NTAB) family NADH-FMN oxidoreductase RutF